MGGAYVASPGTTTFDWKPTGWDSDWAFPGPYPPGYTPASPFDEMQTQWVARCIVELPSSPLAETPGAPIQWMYNAQLYFHPSTGLWGVPWCYLYGGQLSHWSMSGTWTYDSSANGMYSCNPEEADAGAWRIGTTTQGQMIAWLFGLVPDVVYEVDHRFGPADFDTPWGFAAYRLTLDIYQNGKHKNRLIKNYNKFDGSGQEARTNWCNFVLTVPEDPAEDEYCTVTEVTP